MNKFIFIILTLLFSSCTPNITMVHTEGEAMDIADQTSMTAPNGTFIPTLPVVK